MIYDSILVCHFPRDAFTTVNQKAAEQFLWVFLSEFNVLQISSGERWLEIQCGQSISQQQVASLNNKLKHSIESAVSDYDIMQHTQLYLKIMFEMGRLAEGVAQIINVKDSTMCHGVASELLTNIKKFAGVSLPQRLHLYQQNNHQFGYMDLPDYNMNTNSITNGFGPTAPMSSTGIGMNDVKTFQQKQLLLNQLAQINYMQQLNVMTNNDISNPYMNMNNININYKHNHNHYNNKQRGSYHLNNDTQSPSQPIHTSQQPQHSEEISNEYMQLLQQVEAAKNKTKKKHKANKRKKSLKKSKKKNRKQSSYSTDTDRDSDSDDSDTDTNTDSDDSDDTDSDESDDESDNKFKGKKENLTTPSSAPKHNGAIGLVEDDDDMKYPPIPFGDTHIVNHINLDSIKTPLPTQHQNNKRHKSNKSKKKKINKKKNKKNRNYKKKKYALSESDSESGSDSNESDEDSNYSNSDSESTQSDSTQSDASNSNLNSSESDESKSFKMNREDQKKFEKDLDLLLTGNIDEYIKKNMAIEMVGLSHRNTSANNRGDIDVNRDELRDLRTHSLSIQIKDVQQLKQQIGDIKHEESDAASAPHNNKDEKSRNRKLDRILRGSKSDLEYTKQVLAGMVDNSDRKSNREYKEEKKEVIVTENETHRPSIHKQHLDNMIDNILAGKNFIPFVDLNDEDTARQSNEDINEREIEIENKQETADELEQIDMEIQADIEVAKQNIIHVNSNENVNINDINDMIHMNVNENDDEDVDEMFADDIINSTNNNKAFQSLIKTVIGTTAINAKKGINIKTATNSSRHHKRRSTRLLLDSLRPSTTHDIEEEEDNHDQLNDEQLTRHITWGMILIELDNFDRLLHVTNMDTHELIDVIKNLIDDSLEYENQYVDHMTEGQFVLLTPVDIIVSYSDELKYESVGGINNEYFCEKKEDRLRDIAASVLQHLSTEEEQLEFCMGVALQDRVTSDQEWFEMARESLEEMKAYREFDRARKQQQQQNNSIKNRFKRRSNKYEF